MHPHDKLAEQQQREDYENMQATGMLDALDQAGSSLGSATYKPGYVNARFKCKVCDHHFKRSEAIEWLTIRNKIGEERALVEYKKLEREFR